MKKKSKPGSERIQPATVAKEILSSVEHDHCGRTLSPFRPADVAAVAAWGRALGIERMARADAWSYAMELHRSIRNRATDQARAWFRFGRWRRPVNMAARLDRWASRATGEARETWRQAAAKSWDAAGRAGAPAGLRAWMTPGSPARLVLVGRRSRGPAVLGPATIEREAEAWARLATKGHEGKDRPWTQAELRGWLHQRVAIYPEQWAALERAARELEARGIMREVGRLDGCGEAWGRVVRLFWKDSQADGGEVSRTYGLHSCKSRHCPRCGKADQARRADEIQRVLEIASEWGLGPEHVRFMTLTVENGEDIPSLREKAHHAWAKMQRRRWWPKHICAWFRATECVTGEDGNWNFHIHIVLVLWATQIDYAMLWDEWESAVGDGKRKRIDVQKLKTKVEREDSKHHKDIEKARKQGGIRAAALYITKYISKHEDLAKASKGPGGISHYVSSHRRLRSFAMGAGASVLRRLAAVLLPRWARRLEGFVARQHLRGGIGAHRAEEVDPETGEAWDVPIPAPGVDEAERRAALALAGPLLRPGGTVGRPAGYKGNWRRVGECPVRGRLLTVKDHEKKIRPEGIQALICGGEWETVKMYRPWDGKTFKTTKRGRLMLKKGQAIPHREHFRVMVPARRFSWKAVGAELWRLLVEDQRAGSVSGQARRQAYQAHAVAAVGFQHRRDSFAALQATLRGLRAETGRQVRAMEEAAELAREIRQPGLAGWLDARAADLWDQAAPLVRLADGTDSRQQAAEAEVQRRRKAREVGAVVITTKDAWSNYDDACIF